MDAADLIVLEGFLDEESVPGGPHGVMARFRLILSPTDDLTDETTLPCTVTDPDMAAAVLNDLATGDRLRVTGRLWLPRTPDDPVRLAVTAIEVLATAPLLSEPAPVSDAVLERYGPYICYLDPDTGQTAAWTVTAAWVGIADTPADLADLFDGTVTVAAIRLWLHPLEAAA